jgi:hypothetical protein
MANPRYDVGFDSINQDRESYLSDGVTITYDATTSGLNLAGRAVNLSADKTVQLAGDGESILGFIDHVEKDGIVVVVTGGYVTNAKGGNGAALTRDSKIVGAVDAGAAKGFVKNVLTDTVAHAVVGRHRLISVGDATALTVKLD